MERTIIKGLTGYEYQHPYDRKALLLLKTTNGLNIVIKKLLEFGYDAFMKVQIMGSGIKVVPENFPVQYELLQEACRILDVEKVPPLYIVSEEHYAETIGSENPIIAISNKLVEHYSEEEFLFVIGHQLSYIKCDSILYLNIADFLHMLTEFDLMGPLGIVSTAIKLALGKWERMARFTADRAGLLCCQDVNVAATAFVKLAGQPENMYDKINIEAFKKQALEFDDLDFDGMNRIVKTLHLLDQTHPPHVIRAAELFRWMDTNEYDNILHRKATLNIADAHKCSYCGEPTLGDENFCTYCGNKISIDVVECMNCHAEIPVSNKFCTGCGNLNLNYNPSGNLS